MRTAAEPRTLQLKTQGVMVRLRARADRLNVVAAGSPDANEAQMTVLAQTMAFWATDLSFTFTCV